MAVPVEDISFFKNERRINSRLWNFGEVRWLEMFRALISKLFSKSTAPPDELKEIKKMTSVEDIKIIEKVDAIIGKEGTADISENILSLPGGWNDPTPF